MSHSKSLLSLLVITGISQAQQPSSAINDGFKKLAPTATISTSKETPIKGIKQINLDTNNVNDVYYMTDDGQYLINGTIIATKNGKNLTEQSKTNKRLDIISQVKQGERLDFFPKDMKYHVTVFTDIDCGYCRKLHKEMKEYNELGIGISYLFWPRAGIQSASFNKAVTVWCSDDQRQAMTNSQNGQNLKPLQCNNPIAQHYQMGRQLGVNGTPNIVTDKGQLIPSYLPPQALLQQLVMLASK